MRRVFILAASLLTLACSDNSGGNDQPDPTDVGADPDEVTDAPRGVDVRADAEDVARLGDTETDSDEHADAPVADADAEDSAALDADADRDTLVDAEPPDADTGDDTSVEDADGGFDSSTDADAEGDVAPEDAGHDVDAEADLLPDDVATDADIARDADVALDADADAPVDADDAVDAGEADAGPDDAADVASDAETDGADDLIDEDVGVDADVDAPPDDAGVVPVSGIESRPVNGTCVVGTSAEGMPSHLSEVGCFDAEDPSVPLGMLIPFEPRAPFWSDGAVKRRWIALPEGEMIRTTRAGDFRFPYGTILVKDFHLAGRMIETRFLVRHTDGEWRGYSYRWDEGSADAVLVPDGEIELIGDQLWYYPTNDDCMRCHTVEARRALGPETFQLDWELTYPSGVSANQIDTLLHIGMLDVARPEIEPIVDPFGEADVISRGRAWLHSNCSGCHRADSRLELPMDFRWTVSEINACNVIPHEPLDIPDAHIITPGDPETSVLWNRIMRRDDESMPPLGSFEIDAAGTDLIREFIHSDYCELYEGE